MCVQSLSPGAGNKISLCVVTSSPLSRAKIVEMAFSPDRSLSLSSNLLAVIWDLTSWRRFQVLGAWNIPTSLLRELTSEFSTTPFDPENLMFQVPCRSDLDR